MSSDSSPAPPQQEAPLDQGQVAPVDRERTEHQQGTSSGPVNEWIDVQCLRCGAVCGQYKYDDHYVARMETSAWVMRVKHENKWHKKPPWFRVKKETTVGTTPDYAIEWISQNSSPCDGHQM